MSTHSVDQAISESAEISHTMNNKPELTLSLTDGTESSAESVIV